MASKVLRNDWLEEEVGELAKEGLRTLVVAKKVLSHEQYKDFEVKKTFIFYSSVICRVPDTSVIFCEI